MCGSNQCESPTCTWSESHRAACEARWLLTILKPKRLDYMTLVAKHRGQEAADRLRADAMTLREQSRSGQRGNFG